MKITYIKGDATYPQGDGLKILPHVCNNIGAWGAGYVLALSKRWKEPEAAYRSIPVDELHLGRVDFISVEEDIIVANMVGQEGIGRNKDGKVPIRYAAVLEALKKVNQVAVELNATLHMPRIGCGLAGGSWDIIELIIKEFITVDVYIYDFE